MSTFPWLTVAGAIPLVGAVAVALTPGLSAPGADADRRARARLVKRITLGFTLVTLAVTIVMATQFKTGAAHPTSSSPRSTSGSRSSACTTRSAWTGSRWS